MKPIVVGALSLFCLIGLTPISHADSAPLESIQEKPKPKTPDDVPETALATAPAEETNVDCFFEENHYKPECRPKVRRVQ